MQLFLGREGSIFMLPGSVEIFSIVRKTERIYGGLNLICNFDLLFVEFNIFHDHFVHIILRFGRVILWGTVFNLSDFFIGGFYNGLIIIGVEESINLIKSLCGIIIFFDDFLTGLAFVVFAL